MKLIAHLVRADIRHFRWAILLWGLLIVGDAIVVANRPAFSADIQAYSNVELVAGLLWWAMQIGMLFLVPLIVHADAAVGTDAFWMTRPLPPHLVFASKVLVLGVFTVLLFCAGRLLLMLWVGVPAREALYVTLDLATTNAAWLALLVAGAAITLNLSRFALLCGGVLVALVVLMTIEIMRAQMGESTATATLQVVSGQPALPPAEDPTEALLFVLCVAVAGFGLAALQYRTRLRRVSVPVAIGGLMLAAFTIPYWPVSFLKVERQLPEWATQPNALQPRAASPVIEISPEAPYFGIANVPRTGTTPVIVGGVEPGWGLRLQLLGSSLALENGTTLTTGDRSYQSTPQIGGSSPDGRGRVVAREVLGVEEVFANTLDTAGSTVMLALPTRALPTAPQVRGHYRGQFAVHLARWEVVAERPLRAGSTFQDGSYRFAIEQILAGPGIALSVRAREWRARSSFDRKPMITYAFYVRNAQRSRAMEAQESYPGGMHFSAGLPIAIGVGGGGGGGGFSLRASVISFPPVSGLEKPKNDWNPAWYADAELVLVRITEQGAILRTLDIPGATLVAKQ